MMVEAPRSADTPADTWEGCSAADLASHWGLPAVHLFESVGSTNDVARRLAQAGAAGGTLVVAEEQRAGRGRGAHSWISPAGLGIWCSFIMRDPAPQTIGLLPIRIALAAAEALDRWAGRPIAVKWPNDLLVDARKLGGILCEASWDGHRLDQVIVGIGVNLLHAPEDFPEPIRRRATSLRSESPEPVSRFQVAGALVAALRPIIRGSGRWNDEDLAEFVTAFQGRDALLVEAGGVPTRIRSGTVHFAGDLR
jgi:BirA family biotin operon repressor/biotin-[acetyl-CoA-carboxylase] ligase